MPLIISISSPIKSAWLATALLFGGCVPPSAAGTLQEHLPQFAPTHQITNDNDIRAACRWGVATSAFDIALRESTGGATLPLATVQNCGRLL